MPSSYIFNLDSNAFQNIDVRLKPYMNGWQLVEDQQGQTVNIPNTWNSEIFPFRYFFVVKDPTDPNYNPDESQNEICLSLMCGWKGYDDECMINLWIMGKAVKDVTQKKVSAEIYKHGGDPMKLYFNQKLVTDFLPVTCKQDQGWFKPPLVTTVETRYFWVDDMSQL